MDTNLWALLATLIATLLFQGIKERLSNTEKGTHIWGMIVGASAGAIAWYIGNSGSIEAQAGAIGFSALAASGIYQTIKHLLPAILAAIEKVGGSAAPKPPSGTPSVVTLVAPGVTITAPPWHSITSSNWSEQKPKPPAGGATA